MEQQDAQMNMKVIAVKNEGKCNFEVGAKGLVIQMHREGLLVRFQEGKFKTKPNQNTDWWARYDEVEPIGKVVFWDGFKKRLMRNLANSHYGHGGRTIRMADSKDKDKPKVDGLEMNWDEIISIIADAFDGASKKMVELEKSLEYNVKQFVEHGESDKKTILDLTEKLQKTRKEREKLDNLYSKVRRFSTIHHALNDEKFTNDEKDIIVKLVGKFIVSTSRDLVKFVLLYGGE